MQGRLIATCVVLLLLAGCGGPAGQVGGTAAAHFVLTDANFQTEVLDSDQPVLVDFYATWCGPCQTMAPVVADVAGDYEGRAVVGQLDVDQNPSIADRYGIASIPTFLVFKDGQVVDRIVGSTSKSGLTGMLDAAMTP